MTNYSKLALVFGIICLMCAAIVSCEKDATSEQQKIASVPAISKEDAMTKFSMILSKAVYEKKDLRYFLKDEAMKEFDRDYDVFYPFVKDRLVDGENTFRDIIKMYDSNNELEAIETALPLLNILIPDWSFIDGFSIQSWNPESQDLSVGYRQFSDSSYIYQNGKTVGSISVVRIQTFLFLLLRKKKE